MMSIRYLLLFLGVGLCSGLRTSHTSIDERTLKTQLQALYQRAGENKSCIEVKEVATSSKKHEQEHARNKRKGEKKLAQQRRQEQYSKDDDYIEENCANLEKLSEAIKRIKQEHQKQQHQRNLKGMLVVPKNK